MDARAAHQSMSKQALNSESIRARILATLLGPGALWEALRAQGGFGGNVNETASALLKRGNEAR